MNWRDQAACKGKPVELFFDHDRVDEALKVCAGCPVLVECGEAGKGLPGVWGGKRPGGRRGPPVRSEHGTRSRYVLGCHCELCKAADAAYHRERKAREPEGRFGGRPWWAPVEKPHSCASDGCGCQAVG